MTPRLPTALVVEDDPDTRAMLRWALAGAARVIEAADGATGFELAVSHRPDLIVLDVDVPNLRGTELLALLRTVHPPLLPTVVLTSGHPELLAEAGREFQDVLVVPKPVEPGLLLGLLDPAAPNGSQEPTDG